MHDDALPEEVFLLLLTRSSWILVRLDDNNNTTILPYQPPAIVRSGFDGRELTLFWLA